LRFQRLESLPILGRRIGWLATQTNSLRFPRLLGGVGFPTITEGTNQHIIAWHVLKTDVASVSFFGLVLAWDDV
jgi:hypothetical protein